MIDHILRVGVLAHRAHVRRLHVITKVARAENKVVLQRHDLQLIRPVHALRWLLQNVTAVVRSPPIRKKNFNEYFKKCNKKMFGMNFFQYFCSVKISLFSSFYKSFFCEMKAGVRGLGAGREMDVVVFVSTFKKNFIKKIN